MDISLSKKIVSTPPGFLKILIKGYKHATSRKFKEGKTLWKSKKHWKKTGYLVLDYQPAESNRDDLLHIRVFKIYNDKNKHNPHHYLDAWCFERDDFRTYRFDRVIGAFILNTGEVVESAEQLINQLEEIESKELKCI